MTKRVLALVLFLALSGVSASADVTSVSTTSTSGGGSASVLDHFYLGYFGNLEGSRVDSLGTPYEVSATGAPTNQSMTLASDVTAAYLITPEIGVGTYDEMNITPVRGADVQLLDVGVTTFDKNLVAYRGLTVFANAIVEVPTTTYDINRGMYAAYETTPYIRYQVPRSRFALGAWTEVKNYAGPNSGKLVKTYYEPYVSYQVVRKLAANVSYELEYDHFAGTSGFSVYETDIQPGVNWSIARGLLLNPYLQYFTNNRLTLDRVAFGASVVARVL